MKNLITNNNSDILLKNKILLLLQTDAEEFKCEMNEDFIYIYTTEFKSINISRQESIGHSISNWIEEDTRFFYLDAITLAEYFDLDIKNIHNTQPFDNAYKTMNIDNITDNDVIRTFDYANLTKEDIKRLKWSFGTLIIKNIPNDKFTSLYVYILNAKEIYLKTLKNISLENAFEDYSC